MTSEARQMVINMGEHYDYDVSYMLYLLEHSEHGFKALNQITDFHANLEHIPTDAAFTAKLMGLKQEDCGPCLQLTIHMASEANVSANQIVAVLKDNTEAMNEDVLVAYQFAASALTQSPAAEQHRQAVLDRWSDAGLIDLTLALHSVRLYPQLKRTLGFDSICHQLQVSDQILPH